MVKYNNDWFLSRIKEERPNDYLEYKFLEPYKRSRDKIKATHLPCGKEIYVIPNTFISRGHGCKECSYKELSKNQTKSHEEYKRSLPDNLTTLEEYTGAHRKIKVHCSLCSNTYDIRARDVAKRGCSHCPGGRYKRTIEDVKTEVSQETNGKYIIVSDDYKNAHTGVIVKHNDCGKTYKVTMANFRKGRRCPYCNLSVGETLVGMVLVRHNIKFYSQKKFNDLKLVNHLSYDFYLPDQKVLIEYQGEQHYSPVEHFGGIDQFKVQCNIDNIKRRYADKNGYKLVEIPYNIKTKQDIEKYLLPHLIYP